MDIQKLNRGEWALSDTTIILHAMFKKKNCNCQTQIPSDGVKSNSHSTVLKRLFLVISF